MGILSLFQIRDADFDESVLSSGDGVSDPEDPEEKILKNHMTVR